MLRHQGHTQIYSYMQIQRIEKQFSHHHNQDKLIMMLLLMIHSAELCII